MFKKEPSKKPDWTPVYEGKIGAIEHNEKGWERFHRPPGVRLLVEMNKDEGPGILLNLEHRHEHGALDYRMPGGKVFDKWIQYKEFLATNPSPEDWKKEYIVKSNFEGLQEVGIERSDSTVYHVQKAGGTVEWDLACIRMTNVRLTEQQLEEDENIERVHLSLNELEEILKKRDENGDYLVKEATSRAELLMWLLENKYWRNKGELVCSICGK